MKRERHAVACPTITTRCVDCGLGTIEAGEWYMVRDDVWEQAWAGRRKSWWAPGQEVLCIGCLEQRINRTLMASDFTDVPANDPFQGEPSVSERLFNRLIAKQPLLSNDMATLDDYLAWRDIELLPEDEREAAWRAWKDGASNE